MNTSKLLFKGIALLLLIPAFMFQSCIKDKFELDKLSTKTEFDGSIAAPLFKSTMTLRDILQDYDANELIEEDETGYMYLLYNDNIASFSASQILPLPSQGFSEVIQDPALANLSSLPIGQTETVKVDNDLDFNVGSTGAEIDKLVVKAANFDVAISSSFPHTGELIIAFPNITKNGQPYTKTFPIDKSDGSYASDNSYTDLAGYTIDLTKGGNTTNTLPVTYEVSLENSGNAGTGADQISIDFSLNNIIYSSVNGYFGQTPVSIPKDTLQMRLYNHALGGNIEFYDPQLKVIYKNSIGVPFDYWFTDIKTFSIFGAESQGLYSKAIPTDSFPDRIMSPSSLGDVYMDSVTITRKNSNIMDILASSPKYIFTGFDAKTNPGTGKPHTNFMTDESSFDVELELKLPLYGKASWFALQDTIEFDFDDTFDEFNDMEQTTLRININNEMPVDLDFQLYFTDANFNVIDSLFNGDPHIISSATVDDEGEVVEKVNNTTDIIVDQQEIEKIKSARYLLFKASIETTDNATKNVRMYSHHSFDVKVGILAKVKVNSEEE